MLVITIIHKGGVTIKNYTTFDNMPLTIRVEDLMPILGIGRNTAYELVRSGQIFSIKVGRQLRIPKQSLISFITENSALNT